MEENTNTAMAEEDFEINPTQADLILSALAEAEISQFPDFVDAVRNLVDENERLRADLANAIAAIAPFASIGRVILAEAPNEANDITLFTDCEGCKHCVTLGAFRKAIAAISTEGNEA
jgi:hypothetical protein